MMLPMRTHVKFSELTLSVVLALIPPFNGSLHGKLSTLVVAPKWGVSGGRIKQEELMKIWGADDLTA